MKMWLTRNLDGDLMLHTHEPVWWENGGRWTSPALELNYNLFPEVTFDNSPQEIELVIKK
jgi:hypothetical protein